MLFLYHIKLTPTINQIKLTPLVNLVSHYQNTHPYLEIYKSDWDGTRKMSSPSPRSNGADCEGNVARLYKQNRDDSFPTPLFRRQSYIAVVGFSTLEVYRVYYCISSEHAKPSNECSINHHPTYPAAVSNSIAIRLQLHGIHDKDSYSYNINWCG